MHELVGLCPENHRPPHSPQLFTPAHLFPRPFVLPMSDASKLKPFTLRMQIHRSLCSRARADPFAVLVATMLPQLSNSLYLDTACLGEDIFLMGSGDPGFSSGVALFFMIMSTFPLFEIAELDYLHWTCSVLCYSYSYRFSS